jgi:undecaprenyl-diphosphatase
VSEMFSAAMQLAALAAVVSYFWSDVHGLATNSLKAIARGLPFLREG